MHDEPPEEGSEKNTLLAREARLRVLVDIACDGIAIIEDGNVVDVSQSVLQRSGCDRDDVIGRPVTDFVAPEYHDIVSERHSAAVEGRLDVVVVTRNGERRWMQVISTSYEARGRSMRLTALRDVSDIRKLEQQLRHAQTIETLGRLATGVAHDFNSILTTIRAFGDLLAQELDDPYRGDAREILKAVDAGAALVRQLLMYARDEAPRPALIDVNTVVRGAEGLVRRLIGPDVQLLTVLAGDLGAVRADPTELQRAILNLAINARDAMPRGGTLTLQTRVAEFTGLNRSDSIPRLAGRYVVLLVSDSGIGIPDELKARIFEPFFTTKEAGKGTGLGLAIVQRIAERSGGFVEVTSEVGAGSTFAIYLRQVE